MIMMMSKKDVIPLHLNERETEMACNLRFKLGTRQWFQSAGVSTELKSSSTRSERAWAFYFFWNRSRGLSRICLKFRKIPDFPRFMPKKFKLGSLGRARLGLDRGSGPDWDLWYTHMQMKRNCYRLKWNCWMFGRWCWLCHQSGSSICKCSFTISIFK